MNLKPATPMQARDLVSAIAALKLARQYLTDADCPAALDAVRRALKSAEGAERHMARRLAASREIATFGRILPATLAPIYVPRLADLTRS